MCLELGFPACIEIGFCSYCELMFKMLLFACRVLDLGLKIKMLRGQALT